MDRRWMYDRYDGGKRGVVKEVFKFGVQLFIDTVKQKPIVIREGGIRCPCAKCQCIRFRSEDEIKFHLCKHGFQPNYWIWTSHGESFPSDEGASSSAAEPAALAPQNHHVHYPFSSMNDMIGDALGFNVVNNGSEDESDRDEYDGDELPNAEAQRFYNLLKETNEPLQFEGSTDSKLTVCVKLLGLKSHYLVPELAMDLIAKLYLETTPTPAHHDMPQNFYQAKQLVSKLGLGVKRIDCCINGCMLFYSNEFGVSDEDLVECKFCEEPRYCGTKNSRSSRRKPVPRKSMFYLPIVSRLQRMYASLQTASKMTWHSENVEKRNSSGELRHPSDGLAWKHFDQVNLDFVSEPRNVRLGLCSAGFTPYTQVSATPYSCWPVIVTPYNLPPEMCMSKPYMFLSAVIPGSSSPTVGIDIYLQPFIDDLKRLWEGVVTYDISRKRNFKMKAALMWTINDFPAYGMLSGWGTHCKLACPICMEDTKAFTLKNGGKATWFDCHHRFLPLNHPFRKNKYAFVKGEIETRGPPQYLTPEQVWDKVKDKPNVQVVGEIEGEIETHEPFSDGFLMSLSFLILLIVGSANAQLSTNFYSKSCPKLSSTVKSTLQSAISKETRMGASILRLFFHDCFVNGCDGSILLDDTSSFTGEKNANPNRNSARGFNVIDNIKTAVENVCPGVVSCADILAIAAADSVAILGGPTWNVKLGRRDAKTASQSAANTAIPAPTSNLNTLTSMFSAVGLSTKDLVALSGAHTIGQARCTNFRARIYNETNIDTSFASTRQSKCPKASGSGDNNLAPLDLQTPTSFDNNYFKNLVNKKGLLHSDQQLFNGGSTNSIVSGYSTNPSSFSSDFAAAMIKMGDIKPLTGSKGEIRKNCRRTN
ncbi:peroxidase P7 [Trifolium repens]|nr:peroxidase P7 [Trifolium repens]